MLSGGGGEDAIFFPYSFFSDILGGHMGVSVKQASPNSAVVNNSRLHFLVIFYRKHGRNEELPYADEETKWIKMSLSDNE